jgi:predicted O-methyltransferase YrrM
MIPKVSWMDLVSTQTALDTRHRGAPADGNVSEFELDVICRLVRAHAPQTIFEIGTFNGLTTLNMAVHAASGAHVFTLDLPPAEIEKTALPLDVGDRRYIAKPVSGDRFAGTDVAARITQFYGDSAKFDFGSFFGAVDFIFVDGSHAYDYVLHDARIGLRLARDSAVILWHDYVPEGPTAWPGVRQALHELYDGDPAFSRLRHIAGTAIVFMQVAGPRMLNSEGAAATSALDSSQPEFLTGELEVSLGPRRDVLIAQVHATNTGRATWLPAGSPVGPVLLGTRLLNSQGTWLDANFSRAALPGGLVAPGMDVRFEASVPRPPPGRYVIEFDLVAEGVAWLSRNGLRPVRIPVEIS